MSRPSSDVSASARRGRGLKVSTRLIGGFVALTVVAAGVGGAGWFAVRGIDDALSGVTARALPAMAQTDDLIALTWESVKVAEEAYGAESVEEATDLQREFGKLSTAAGRVDSSLDDLVDRPSMQEPLDRARPLRDGFEQKVHQLMDARRTFLAERRDALQSVAEFDRAGAALKAQLADFAERNRAEMVEAEDDADRLVRSGADADAVNRVLGELFEDDFPVVMASLGLTGLVNAMDSVAASYLAQRTPERLPELERRFADLKDRLQPQLALLQEHIESDAGKRDLETLQAGIADWTAKIEGEDGLFADHSARLAAQTEAKGLLKQVGTRGDQVIAELDQLVAAADALAADNRAQAGNAVSQGTTLILVLLGVALAIAAGLVLLVVRTVTGPINAITGTMRRLAEGDTGVEIPGAGRRDEIGDMAGAVQVFKDNAVEKERLEAEQKEAERRAEAEKRQAMHELADRFQSEVGGIVERAARPPQSCRRPPSSCPRRWRRPRRRPRPPPAAPTRPRAACRPWPRPRRSCPRRSRRSTPRSPAPPASCRALRRAPRTPRRGWTS
jgi:methyl-accepting chemotaxis protein